MDRSSTEATERERIDSNYDLKQISSNHTQAVTVTSDGGDDNLTLWQALRKWRRVTLYCVGMSSAILLYGFDYAIVGTSSAMPSFQRDFGQRLNGKMILPSLWLGLWNFASPGVAMIGSLIGGQLQDIYGRRVALAIGSILSAVGVAICFTSNLPDDIDSRRGMFLAGKGFQGGAIGIIMATTQAYMSEILPPKLRGPILTFFPIFTILGQLIGALVIFACLKLKNGYIICFATMWPISVIPLVMSLVVPESPTYLVRMGRFDDAHKAQKRLDPVGGSETTEQIIDTIRLNIEHEQQETQATYLDCFAGANLRRTLVIIWVNLLPQIFGLALLAKSSYFVQTIGVSYKISVLLLILGLVVGLMSNGASILVLAHAGHRRVSLVSLVALTLIWTSVGISGCFQSPNTKWYTSAMLTVVVITASLGVWPASYAIGSETSSLQLRAKSQGIGWFTAGASAAVFGFFLPYVFNTDQGNLGSKTGFMYAGLCAVGLVVTFLYVPEMKGRTTAEIDRMFELQLPARQFRHWKSDLSGVGMGMGDGAGSSDKGIASATVERIC